jgi:hypothetical protein
MRGDLIFTLTSFLSRQRERRRITSLPVKFSGVSYPLIDSIRRHILQGPKECRIRLARIVHCQRDNDVDREVSLEERGTKNGSRFQVQRLIPFQTLSIEL